MYFVLSRAVAGGTVDCTFVMRAVFQPGSLSPWPKLVKCRSKCGDCPLVTTARTPVSQRTDVHGPSQCGSRRYFKKSFDNTSGALPGTTCTRRTPLTPAIPAGSMATVPGFQCLVVTKTEGHGLVELDLLRAQTPSSCEHPFPLFESTFFVQSRRVSILCQ